MAADEGRQCRIKKHPDSRLGQPQEQGKTGAYLCNVHAGYINGPNWIGAGSYWSGITHICQKSAYLDLCGWIS